MRSASVGRACLKGAHRVTVDHKFKREARHPNGMAGMLQGGDSEASCIAWAYYIKTAADDVRHAMSRLENNIPAPKSLTDTFGTLNERAAPRSDAIP